MERVRDMPGFKSSWIFFAMGIITVSLSPLEIKSTYGVCVCVCVCVCMSVYE